MNKKAIVALLAACTLLLAACGQAGGETGGQTGGQTDGRKNGGAEQPVPASSAKTSPAEEITGADWRTWGTIDGYGTLHIDGEDVDVCACVFGDRVELYYDEASQSLYRQIDYPEKLTTEQYQKAQVSFEDFDGDGSTDVRVTVGDDGGTELWWTWAWDTDDFVYMAALAYPPVPVTDGAYAELYLPEIEALHDAGKADRFAFVDVDGDDVPELAAVSSEGSWDKEQVFLYTVCDGKAVLLASDIAPGMEGHSIAFCPGENIVERSGALMGEKRDIFEIRDGALQPVLSLQRNTDPVSGEDVFFVDGTETDEAAYHDAEEAFVSGHDTMVMLDIEELSIVSLRWADGYREMTAAGSVPYMTFEQVTGG